MLTATNNQNAAAECVKRTYPGGTITGIVEYYANGQWHQIAPAGRAVSDNGAMPRIIGYNSIGATHLCLDVAVDGHHHIADFAISELLG